MFPLILKLFHSQTCLSRNWITSRRRFIVVGDERCDFPFVDVGG